MGIRTDWYGVPLNREQCPTLTCMHGGKDFTRLGSIAALRLSKAPDFSSYLLPKCRLGRFWSWKRRKISFYQGWHGLQDTVKAEEIALAWRIGLSRASSSTVWIILDAFVNMRERWARNPPMMMDTKSFCSKLHWEKQLRMKTAWLQTVNATGSAVNTAYLTDVSASLLYVDGSFTDEVQNVGEGDLEVFGLSRGRLKKCKN